MYYLDLQEKLKTTLEKVLSESSLSANTFIDEIYSIVKDREITLEETGIIMRQLTRIITKEKHRDQLVELLDENFDWPQDMLREIATEIDDKILSPLQKYIKNYAGSFETEKQQIEKEAPVIENINRSNESRRNTDQKSEIEILREKVKQLEEKQWQNVPQTELKREPTPAPVVTQPAPAPKQPTPPQNLPTEPEQTTKRFGVAPARDLDTADFDWQGNVGGVEIEKSVDENQESEGEEGLSKAQILEEVEHPPIYTPTTSFEKRLGQSEDVQTNFANQNMEPSAPKPSEVSEEIESEPLEIPNEDVEQKRKETYKESDPYREPIE